MKRNVFAVLLAVSCLLLWSSAGLAADRTAKLVGFEKAEMMTGTATLMEDGSLVFSGFSTTYGEPLEVYLSRGYDTANASFAGVLAPGFSGQATLKVDITDVVDVNMVYITTPGWSAPLGLGLLRAPGEEPAPPGEVAMPAAAEAAATGPEDTVK